MDLGERFPIGAGCTRLFDWERLREDGDQTPPGDRCHDHLQCGLDSGLNGGRTEDDEWGEAAPCSLEKQMLGEKEHRVGDILSPSVSTGHRLVSR